jgi:hypothetical protein
MRLAYPSVRVSLLRAKMRESLTGLDGVDIERQLKGYPKYIVDSLVDPVVRTELADTLADALELVRYDEGSVGESWVPDHVSHDVPRPDKPCHPGLPTGLAVAGSLLNVYLRKFDVAMESWLEQQPSGRRAAVLRFVDDVIVLGQTESTLAEAIDETWRALEGFDSAVLARPSRAPNSSNMRLNLGKVEPEPLRTKMREYLVEFKWDDKMGDIVEPSEFLGQIPTFAEWLRGQAPNWLHACQLRRDRIGPFVTRLIEQMSELGGESLDDRFGRGAQTRLEALHQLIRLQIDDPQVRADTRLSFAANKISRAFLPDEGRCTDIQHIAAIRQSIREAVVTAPWKFSLWRTVLRAACRRGFAELNEGETQREETSARRWLESVLIHISARGSSDECWLSEWPETNYQVKESVAQLYLSFLRAQFWLMLAEVIRDLRRVCRPEDTGSPSHWSSLAWTFRAVDERRAPMALAMVEDLNCWAAVLYPEGVSLGGWWEADGLATAVLATTSAFQVVGAQRLTVPAGRQTRILKLLHDASRVAKQPLSETTELTLSRVAHFTIAARPHGEELAEIVDGLLRVEPERILRWSAALGVLNRLPRDKRRLDELCCRVAQQPTLPALEELARARRVELAYLHEPIRKRRRWTLHRLLWSVVDKKNEEPVLRPSAAPVVGLPPRVAFHMLVDALRADLASGVASSRFPVWVLKGRNDLWGARCNQLSGKGWEPLMPTARRSTLVSPGRESDWEIPRHPSYHLPAAVEPARVTTRILNIWTHMLQFLTAAQGSEAFLDEILASWPTRVPLDERWALRADVPLPISVWKAIDASLHAALAADEGQLVIEARNLVDEAGQVPAQDIMGDFNWDRVDVVLTLSGGELPVGCAPFYMRPRSPEGLFALSDDLAGNLAVTIAQISATPDWLKYRKDFEYSAPPSLPRSTRQQIMVQVSKAFTERQVSVGHSIPEGPILFPEVALPLEEIPSFRKHAIAKRRAGLIGLMWRILPFAAPSNRTVTGCVTRYLVNEALFVIPLIDSRDKYVVQSRAFCIRKPLPTHIEHSLVASLNKQPVRGSQWAMMPGSRWYRFVHPLWGDFTVAICSDLIDPSPWKSLQGQVLHLFLISYNTDIQLYDTLTWLRAYEVYGNVVAVNHGAEGGSFAWTPLHSDSKELARLRGSRLSLVAEVIIPVKDLAVQQRMGVKQAVQQGIGAWENEQHKQLKWKAPPPGYHGRCDDDIIDEGDDGEP